MPLVWAQSLWWLAQMLDDGLLDRSDIDPLGRHRRRPKPAPPVQIAILAEDLETQTQLAALGIRVERVDELETIELRPARDLARFYSAQGAAPVLGLTGRPERRLRSLTTARFYRLGDRRLAFAPSIVADWDHLALDMAILCQRLRSEVAYLSRYWQSQGFPTLVVPFWVAGILRREPTCCRPFCTNGATGIADRQSFASAPLDSLWPRRSG